MMSWSHLCANVYVLLIREREADIAEQTAKMHAIEADMELVSAAFSEQTLQIETLKMNM